MFVNTTFNFESKTIQNELIHIIANKVSITIFNKIKNVGFYKFWQMKQKLINKS